MKNIILTALIFIGSSINLFSQRAIIPSDSFVIFGKVKSPLTIKIQDLSKLTGVEIPTQVIYNHKGEIKDTLRNLAGIPLKSILLASEYIYSKPKELNEFYFVLKATDGYRVVLSWNEIYNANSDFYVLTRFNGKPIAESNNRMIFISTSDLKPGRRYIKALSSIEVKELE